jgi:hypothetical protein
MPWNYSIDKERRLIISKAWDRLTFAEARAHEEELESDPDFDPEFNQLIDLTGVTTFDVSTVEAKVLSTRLVFSPKSRRALVATNPQVFGMGRLLESYHIMGKARDETRVFYKREEAMAWLGYKP